MNKLLLGSFLFIVGFSTVHAAEGDSVPVDPYLEELAVDELYSGEEEDTEEIEAEPVEVDKADKACGTIICITGEMIGISGDQECDGYIDDYFDIKKYRHGSYSASRTAKARKHFLNRCDSTEGRPLGEAVNAAFGGMPDNPF